MPERILEEVNPDGGGARLDLMVVPNSPGPLIALPEDRRRHKDDLDDLIDELLPDVEERSGWFDAGLLILGAVLVVWALVGRPPPIVAVLGVLSLGLGCVLPLRGGWRRVEQRRRRRRRDGLLTKGHPIETSSPSTSRLVRAYEDLLGVKCGGRHELGDVDPSALAAAHGALLEVASLLGGRAPQSGREAEYVEKRAVAIEALTQALRESRARDGDSGHEPQVELEPGTLVEAREELDQVAGFSSISRLDELTEEARIRHHGDA
jgi:hypothetical protein